MNSTPLSYETLFQDSLKYKKGYLDITNIEFLNYVIQHPQKNKITEINLELCTPQGQEAFEILEKEIDNLSINSLYFRSMKIDSKSLNQLIYKSGFKILKKISLSYYQKITDQTISDLIKISGNLAVKVLNIDGADVTDEGIMKLASSMCFKNLKELDMSGCVVSDEAIKTLSKPISIPKLSKLNVLYTEVSDSSLPYIVQSSKFSRLISLELSHLNFFDSGLSNSVIFCKKSPYSLRLKELTLKNCTIGPQHIKLICRSQNFSELRLLNLYGNDLDDKSLCELHKARFQATLKHLFLAYNTISHRFLSELGKSKCYQILETIDLVSCPSIRSLEVLTWKKKKPFQFLYLSEMRTDYKQMTKIFSNNFLSLRKLKLSNISGISNWLPVFQKVYGESKLQVIKINVAIGNDSLRSFLTQVRLPSLERLKLSEIPGFNQETMQILCFTQKLLRLSSLSLRGNSISDLESSCLQDTTYFPMLKILDLHKNYNISTQSVQNILESPHLPWLEVIFYSHGKVLNKYENKVVV